MAVSQPRRSRSQPCKIDDFCGYTEDDLDAVFAPELAGLRELFHAFFASIPY